MLPLSQPAVVATMPRTRTLAAQWVVAAIAAAAAQYWLKTTFWLVEHPVSLGAANLEPDAAIVRGWYRQLIAQDSYLQMIRTEAVDLVWAVCLAATFVTFYRLVGGALRRRHPGIAAGMYRWAPLAALAPALDLTENAISLAMLTDPYGFPDVWAEWHATVSRMKVSAAVLSAVIGLTLTGIALIRGAPTRKAADAREPLPPR